MERIVRKSTIGTPQFPGQQKGKNTIADVQAFIKEQRRAKGYRLSGGTTAQKFPIDLSGTARFVYGFAFLGASFGLFQFSVNNEIIFEDCDTGFFQFGQTDQDYFAFNRPLSGKDDISIQITGDAAYENRSIIFWYK